MGKRTTKYPKYIRRAKGLRAGHGFKFRIANKFINTGDIYFRFKKYGGEKEALQAAIDYRDKILRKNKLTYLIKVPNKINIRTVNPTSSGIIGIRLAKVKPKDKDIRLAWSLKYYEDGQEFHRSYSCELYGYEHAFLLACKYKAKRKNYIVIVDKSKLPVSIPTLVKFLSNAIPKENIIIK